MRPTSKVFKTSWSTLSLILAFTCGPIAFAQAQAEPGKDPTVKEARAALRAARKHRREANRHLQDVEVVNMRSAESKIRAIQEVIRADNDVDDRKDDLKKAKARRRSRN